MRLYVGNLSYTTTEETLREAFEEYGVVESAAVITDRETGRPRGFGFVEMPNDEEAQRAIDSMNGQQLDGRPLTVNEAQARPPRRDGGGGGRGFGGGGGRDRRW